MVKIIACFIALAGLALALSCGNSPTGSSSADSSNGDSPTAAYKRLFAAVKSKDTEAIKKEMSEKTKSFAESVAARQNTKIEKVFENGFTATTFAESLPEIRDERIGGEFGAVEVYNSKDKRWEDLPFVNEGGTWKLAIGEMFANTFKSPGKGRDQKEKEAANAANPMNNMTQVNVNMNQNVKVITPKERPESMPANK
jgi:hypothetical protein